MRVVATLALLVASACGPRLPPPLTPLALQAPVIAAAPEVADASLFGFLRLRKLTELVEKLGLSGADKLIASLGITLRDLPAEAPLALYLWEPGEAGLAGMALAAFLPMPPDAPLPARLRLMLGADKLIAAPGGTLIGITPRGMLRARPQADALAKLTAAPMSSQIELHVRVAPIRAHYHAQIDDFFEQVAKTPSKTGTAETPQMKRLQGWMSSEWHKWFENLSSMTLNETATSEYVESTITLREAAPTAAAAPPPLSSPDLVGFLPDGQIRFEFDGGHVQGGFTAMIGGVYDALLKDDPTTRDRMSAWIKRWAEASVGSRIGGTISLGEKGMSGASLIVSPRADKVMALLEDGYLLMAAEPMRKAMRQGALEIAVERQLAVRKIQGWSVNRYNYSSKPINQQITPEQRQLMNKLNNNTFEIIRIGNFVIQTINGQPGVLEALVADVLSGQRHGRSLTAKKDFPVSGLFHADFDAATMYESFRKLMPPSVKLAPLPSGPPALTLYGYAGAGVSEYRLRVPAGFIAAVRAATK